MPDAKTDARTTHQIAGEAFERYRAAYQKDASHCGEQIELPAWDQLPLDAQRRWQDALEPIIGELPNALHRLKLRNEQIDKMLNAEDRATDLVHDIELALDRADWDVINSILLTGMPPRIVVLIEKLRLVFARRNQAQLETNVPAN